ncbi:MAG: hypothetical protein QNJ33_14370 [Crocosphaera sp.]|nr:hypothetical protein [Crocosphaera sp.]
MLNLPLVLDIAIGLVFVYITLSLVASEIQEIISTLLQLRAKHLKTSIKYLLMGSDVDSVEEIKQTKQLIDELYNNPLIKNLNHQGQGTISHWFKIRKLNNTDTPIKLKKKLIQEVDKIKEIDLKEFKNQIEKIANESENKKNALEISMVKFKEIFNELLIKKSDKNTRHKLIKIREKLLDNAPLPSYIPSDTFATTLLEVLKIPRLTHYLSCNKLKGLLKRLVKKLSEIEGIDEVNIEKFIKEIKEVYDNFCDKKYTLEISLLRIKTRLNELIVIFENSDNGENNKVLVKKLSSIRDTFFEENNFEILCQEMKLNLVYIAQILDPDFLDENGKLNLDKKAKILEEIDNNQNQSENNDILTKFDHEFNKDTEQRQQVQEEIEYILGKLPKTLKDSIVTLAHRAQTKIETTQQDIEQLSQEIEIWFNNSMERASGVYKRNSKGLALIISFSIAVFANADSFHMISRLSTDTILRDALVKSAVALEKRCNSDDSFDCIKSTTQKNLEELSLPIGWSCINFEQQTSFRAPFFCENRQNTVTPVNYFVRLIKILKTFLGLILSTVAISMGASFWFDILGKIVNVRNTGMKPSATVQGTTKSSKAS